MLLFLPCFYSGLFLLGQWGILLRSNSYDDYTIYYQALQRFHG